MSLYFEDDFSLEELFEIAIIDKSVFISFFVKNIVNVGQNTPKTILIGGKGTFKLTFEKTKFYEFGIKNIFDRKSIIQIHYNEKENRTCSKSDED